MAEPIANDWKAIHDRMQQIKAEQYAASHLLCLRCNDRGWLTTYPRYQRAHEICDVCRNSKNMPRPSSGRY